jgi:hypothetical protein
MSLLSAFEQKEQFTIKIKDVILIQKQWSCMQINKL